MSEQGGLVTSEGVGEGSAAATAEGPGTGTGTDTGTGRAQDLEQHVAPGEDLLGEPPRGAPDDESGPAEPVDTESEQSRAARAAGTGQQLQSGEG